MKQTKKQIQSEETREKILHASANLLISRSYSGTTISAIAAEIGLTKGALYHHFSSKETLVLEIVKSVKESWFEFVGRKAFLKDGSVDRLQELFTLHSQFLKEDPTICLVLSSLLTELEILSPVIRDEIKAIIVKCFYSSNESLKEVRKTVNYELIYILRKLPLLWLECSVGWGVHHCLNYWILVRMT
jgi:AcrR family transcriptional regulator